jgi:hypothetical protein
MGSRFVFKSIYQFCPGLKSTSTASADRKMFRSIGKKETPNIKGELPNLLFRIASKVLFSKGRLIDAPEQKLTARIKSIIRRRARQLAAKRSRALPSGSMRDMEQLHVGHSEAEQRSYANELFSRLLPTAQSIFDWRWLG